MRTFYRLQVVALIWFGKKERNRAVKSNWSYHLKSYLQAWLRRRWLRDQKRTKIGSTVTIGPKIMKTANFLCLAFEGSRKPEADGQSFSTNDGIIHCFHYQNTGKKYWCTKNTGEYSMIDCKGGAWPSSPRQELESDQIHKKRCLAPS